MINNLLALSINQYQIIKKMCLNLNSFTFKILFFLTSVSFVFGQTDFLSSLVYDATKTYDEGDSVIPSVDLSDQIYTARKSVPLDTPPVDSSGEISNEDYWATSGDYTTELATSNSAALSDVPDDAIVDTQQVENLGTPTEDIGEDNETVPSGLTSASNKAFVMQQYLDFLGRDGDTAGIEFWTAELDNGTQTRADCVNNFVFSDEFQQQVAPVSRLYLAYFLRIPDSAGLEFWINEKLSGKTLSEISDSFADSTEFQNTYGSLNNSDFVDLVYSNLFDREADSAGFAYWTGQLDNSIDSRGTVMASFSESQENITLTESNIRVISFYYGMLRRAPEQAGYDFWVNELKIGKSPNDLINEFIASEEYQQRFN
jgi:hypothetical protein